MSRAINSELGSIIDARCIELQARLQQAAGPDSENALLGAAIDQIKKCRSALRKRHIFSGSLIPIAQSYYDAAFTLYLRATLKDTISSTLPSIIGVVRDNLPPKDSQRSGGEEIAERVAGRIRKGDGGEGWLGGDEGETLLEALEAAQKVKAEKTLRVRSFVRIVVAVGIFLAIAAAFVMAMGALYPRNVPLCFVPQIADPGFQTVCPVKTASGGTPAMPNTYAMNAADYPVVETIGLVAAGLAAAATIRRMRGTTTPYNVGLALAFLKLPTGALTAPLGIQLMRGSFVPGLSALDSSAQIVSWAIIFGYAQQLLTFMVDRQAQSIVGNSRSEHECEPARGSDSDTHPNE